MNTSIFHSDVEHQLGKLKAQNLFMPEEDIDVIAGILDQHGYSNVVKNYRDPYIVRSASGIEYRDGVTFYQIYSLYLFDKNLRIAVMAAMLDFEEYIKEAAANVLARSFGTKEADYLKYTNFQNRRKRKKQFSLKGILDKMNMALESDKEPISHYRKKDGNVPPWILFKGVYFSTIINFIDQFRPSETKELIDIIYDKTALPVSDQDMRRFMMDSLFICSEYRNVAAHGGMIYNMKPQKEFGNYGSAHFSYSGFSILLYILGQFRYKTPYSLLKESLAREIERHCKSYPADSTYLGQILNVNIISKREGDESGQS